MKVSILFILISFSILSCKKDDVNVETLIEGEQRIIKKEFQIYTEDYSNGINNSSVLNAENYRSYVYFRDIVNNSGIYFSKISNVRTVYDSMNFPLYEVTAEFITSLDIKVIIEDENKLSIGTYLNYQIVKINTSELILDRIGTKETIYLIKE